MPTLHIRSVPEDLYWKVHKLAQKNSRSLSAQVVTMLYEAADEEEHQQEQKTALNAIRRRRFALPADVPTSSELLREDRNR
jgi:hypothetical protein